MNNLKFSPIEIFKLLNAKDDDWAIRILKTIGCIETDAGNVRFPLAYTDKGVELMQLLYFKKLLFDIGIILLLFVVLISVLGSFQALISSLIAQKIFYIVMRKKYLHNVFYRNCSRSF